MSNLPKYSPYSACQRSTQAQSRQKVKWNNPSYACNSRVVLVCNYCPCFPILYLKPNSQRNQHRRSKPLELETKKSIIFAYSKGLQVCLTQIGILHMQGKVRYLLLQKIGLKGREHPFRSSFSTLPKILFTCEQLPKRSSINKTLRQIDHKMNFCFPFTINLCDSKPQFLVNFLLFTFLYAM